MIAISYFFFQLYLIAFPFGQLLKFPIDYRLARVGVYLTDMFLFLALLFGFRDVASLFRKKADRLSGLIAFGLIGFSGLAMGYGRYSLGEIFIGGLYFVRWWIYLSLILLTAVYLKRKIVSKKHLLEMLLGVGTFLVVFGLVQYLIWPDLRTFEVAQWDPHYYRIVGTFLDPGFTGLIYVFTFLVNLHFIDQGKRKVFYFVGSLAYLGLVFTYSRSSYLAFLAGLGAWSVLKKNWRYLAIGVLVLGLTILALPRPSGEGVRLERISTVKARLLNYARTAEIIKSEPFLGVGFNLYRYAQREMGYLDYDWEKNHAAAGADSSLLFIGATTGVLGLAAYLVGWQRILKTSLTSQTKLILVPAIVAVMFHSLFLNSLFYPWAMGWISILVGVGFRSARSE